MQVTSPDLSVFDISVLYDLSGQAPFVKITNNSQGIIVPSHYGFTFMATVFVAQLFHLEGTVDGTPFTGDFIYDPASPTKDADLVAFLAALGLGVWTSQYDAPSNSVTFETDMNQKVIIFTDANLYLTPLPDNGLNRNRLFYAGGFIAARSRLMDCWIMFELYSSSGVAYHLGTWATPDIRGDVQSWIGSQNILQVLNHVEWSGNDFLVRAYLKDSLGQIFKIEIATTICRPQGNKTDQRDNYGAGKVDVQVLCDRARVQAQDVTNYSYKGLPGVLDQKTLTFVYPQDKTGFTPPPFVIENYNYTSLIPVWYSSKGYQIIQETIMIYDLGNGSTVRLKYKYKQFIDVLCNVDLCELGSEVNRMLHRVGQEGCSGEQRDRLIIMSVKMQLAIIAKLQPTCKLDLARLVEEIKELGGITCDCYRADGILQQSTIAHEGWAPNSDSNIPQDLTPTIS